MTITRPLARKVQAALQLALSCIELGELDRAKSTIKSLSKLISDQTVAVVETKKESEDLQK